MNKDNSQRSLFDEEDFQQEQTAQSQSDPVTVLGRTFANDDERREYFRTELRRLLPELRKIEGFPIGEEDDIIALSDPPYYTACPNPWLNEIVSEWEAEKEALLHNGIRLEDSTINEPYTVDVSEGRSNPVYIAHTYHTKVPHPAVMRFILHYTEPGDIIYDGFCGTGMMGVAATNCGNQSEFNKVKTNSSLFGIRHAICSDLSPLASSISAYYNTHSITSKVIKEATRILEELEEEYGWMYETQDEQGHKGYLNLVVWSEYYICPNCGEILSFWENAVSYEKKTILDQFPCPKCHAMVSKDCEKVFETEYDLLKHTIQTKALIKPSFVVYTTNDGKRVQRLVNYFDLKLIEKINQTPIDNLWIPQDRMPEGEEARRNDREGRITVDELFFRRTLIVLSALYSKITSSNLSFKLIFLFTGLLTRSSLLNRFSAHNFFFGGGGWNKGNLSGTLYVPAIPVETPLFVMLRSRIECVRSISSFLPKEDNITMVSSACQIPLADNTIDYIFTDPPFGANIMYSELNFISEAWLKVFTNNATEAIVNKVQQKDLFEYQSLMQRSLREYYRILKPGKWLTMEFSNTSAAVWNSIQTALQGVGFVVANVSALDKKQGSFKAVTTTTAVKQDLIISCFKPSENLTTAVLTNEKDIQKNVWDFIEELINRLGRPEIQNGKLSTVGERTSKILYGKMIAYYVQLGVDVPLSASEFQKGLSERFIERDGMFFNADQVVKYDELRLQATEIEQLALFVGSEAEGIAWLKNELRERGPRMYSELTNPWNQALVTSRKGDQLPELKEILDENFIKDESERWRLPDAENEADLEKMRTKKLLHEFKAYIEKASKPKGKIKEARLEALRTGFKQCYQDKDFVTIVKVGNRIPQTLLTEDELLLQYYQIAARRL